MSLNYILEIFKMIIIMLHIFYNNEKKYNRKIDLKKKKNLAES